MFKQKNIKVREHSEEREWLVDLGEGNLVAGVRQLIQQMEEQQSRKDSPKRKKVKWGK
jgi:hypothetical protein